MCAQSSACFKASSSLPGCLRSKKGLPDTREDPERCRNHPGCYRASGKRGQKASREIRGEEKVQLGSLNNPPDCQLVEIGRGFFFAQVGGVISTPAFPGPWARSVPARLQLLSRYPPPKKLFSKEEPQNISSPCGCCGARCTCGRRTERAAAKKRGFAIKAARFGAHGCDFQQGSPRSHLVSPSWGALCSLL